jgi:hypothetical protein
VSTRTEHDVAARGCVLESVMQQVHGLRRQQLRITVDRQLRISGFDREPDVPVISVEGAYRREFVEEGDDRQSFAPLCPRAEADFGERKVDHVRQTGETAPEHGADTSVDGDVGSLECVERENGGIEDVSQLASGVPKTFNVLG